MCLPLRGSISLPQDDLRLELVMRCATGGTGFESPASPRNNGAALRVPSESKKKHGRHGSRPSTLRASPTDEVQDTLEETVSRWETEPESRVFNTSYRRAKP